MNSEKKKTPFYLSLEESILKKKREKLLSVFLKEKTEGKKGRKMYFFFLFLSIIETSLCFQVKQLCKSFCPKTHGQKVTFGNFQKCQTNF